MIALRNLKICSSGTFISTWIFSGAQLREVKIFWQARLTVNTWSANRMLDLFQKFEQPDAQRFFPARPKMVIINSGMGSCRSRMTFAPRNFGDQPAEHQKVRHIVDMHQLITLFEAHASNRKNEPNRKPKYWKTRSFYRHAGVSTECERH